MPEHASGQPHEIGQRLKAVGVRSITPGPAGSSRPHHAKEEFQRQWSASDGRRVRFRRRRPGRARHAAVLSYLEETQKAAVGHLRPLRRHVVEDHLADRPGQLAVAGDRPHRPRTGGTDRSAAVGAGPDPHADGRAVAPAMAAVSAAGRWSTSPPARRRSRRWSRRRRCCGTSSIDLDDICDIERIVGRVAVGRVGPARPGRPSPGAWRACRGSWRRWPRLPAAADVAPGPGRHAAVLPGASRVPCNSAVKSDPRPAPARRRRHRRPVRFRTGPPGATWPPTASSGWPSTRPEAVGRVEHPVAEGRLQQGVRLLHRSHQRPQGQGPRRSGPASRPRPPASGTSRPS